MNPICRVRVVTTIALLIACAEIVFACQCGMTYREKNAWESAKLAEQNATVIFEGTPIKFELRWRLLTANEGELIPADIFSPGVDYLHEPNMVVTFRVNRAYKGTVGTEMQVHTGLGGGDCAAGYASGLNYLVYADGPSPDALQVSMCSPGGWVEARSVATDLRYLRKQHPTPKDLIPIRRWSQADFAKEAATRKKDYEGWRKKFDAATGRICGKLAHADPKDNGEGSIAFLPMIGYSPNLPAYAELKEDGSFCSPNLSPDKYYLYFVQQDDHGASALYYPGVADVAKAIPIEVRAGQMLENIIFKVARQSSYSVRGFVSADDRSVFDPEPAGASILLIRSDGDRRVWYSAKTTVRLLPKLLYFKFENVVPGRYFAFVQGSAGWMSRKVVVDVTTHSKFISVDFVRNKQ